MYESILFLSLFQQGKDLKWNEFIGGVMSVTVVVSIPFSAGQRLKEGGKGFKPIGSINKFLSLFQQGKDLKKGVKPDTRKPNIPVSIPFSAGQRLKVEHEAVRFLIDMIKKFLSLFQQGKDLKDHVPLQTLYLYR